MGRHCVTQTYSVVMTTVHSQSFTRSRKDSAENPANTAECTAPILAQAKKAATACQVMGRLLINTARPVPAHYRLTASPFFTPQLLRTFATRHVSRMSSA